MARRQRSRRSPESLDPFPEEAAATITKHQDTAEALATTVPDVPRRYRLLRWGIAALAAVGAGILAGIWYSKAQQPPERAMAMVGAWSRPAVVEEGSPGPLRSGAKVPWQLEAAPRAGADVGARYSMLEVDEQLRRLLALVEGTTLAPSLSEINSSAVYSKQEVDEKIAQVDDQLRRLLATASPAPWSSEINSSAVYSKQEVDEKVTQVEWHLRQLLAGATAAPQHETWSGAVYSKQEVDEKLEQAVAKCEAAAEAKAPGGVLVTALFGVALLASLSGITRIVALASTKADGAPTDARLQALEKSVEDLRLLVADVKAHQATAEAELHRGEGAPEEKKMPGDTLLVSSKPADVHDAVKARELLVQHQSLVEQLALIGLPQGHGGGVSGAATGSLVGGAAGGLAGGAAGTAGGGAIGAALGLVPAIFTFGFSIPVGAALGSAVGMAAGTVAGGATGAVAGAVDGYHEAAVFGALAAGARRVWSGPPSAGKET